MTQHKDKIKTVKNDTEKVHINVRNLNKSFKSYILYQGLNLDIVKGKITSIFGPNGCGKSTLINVIAGLTNFDRGEVNFEGRSLSDARIGYVFQNYKEALFPWLTTIENIRYPLKFLGLTKKQQKERIDEIVDSFGVGIDLKRYPYQLSGGQQQLISILRALVTKPEVVFFDEPFSSLDYETTLFIRDKVQTIFEQYGITMVIVSHDLEETVYMADKIILLTKPPTKIAEKLDCNSSRPRNVHTLSDPDFVNVKARCLDTFQKQVEERV